MRNILKMCQLLSGFVNTKPNARALGWSTLPGTASSRSTAG